MKRNPQSILGGEGLAGPGTWNPPVDVFRTDERAEIREAAVRLIREDEKTWSELPSRDDLGPSPAGLALARSELCVPRWPPGVALPVPSCSSAWKLAAQGRSSQAFRHIDDFLRRHIALVTRSVPASGLNVSAPVARCRAALHPRGRG
jgi:hypothetical protein